MNKFNVDEFNMLKALYNPNAYEKNIVITYENKNYFDRIKHFVETDRRGEVVFAVKRQNGKIISVTSKEYPEGIYRIPTGGICHGEDIVDALYREAREELGLETEIISFLGVLKIRICNNNSEVYFYSYIFILEEKGGRLLEDATDDEVSDVLEVDFDEINDLCDRLLNIQYDWKDWGIFRYQTTKAVADYMAQ